MAYVVFTDGKKSNISAEQGLGIWQVLNGEIEGDEKQQEFCRKVEKIYLNWRNAPDNYIKANFDLIMPMALSDWMVNEKGQPTEPETGNDFAWKFAKRWGLWEYGPTKLVKEYHEQR